MKPNSALPAPRAMPEGFVARLREICGEGAVSEGRADRLANARDMWPRLQLLAAQGSYPGAPDIVVWPEDGEAVAGVLRAAREAGVPVVPFGGGSGVCGGAAALRGGVSLDLKRMDRIESIDPDQMTVTVQAGVNGELLERRLQARGFTVGHFPSSIYCSTVGGWLAARGAGQMSTRYGKIEDMVLGVEAVFPDGRRVEIDGWSRGIDWVQTLVGSEGTLGVITRARLRLRPAPERRLLRGVVLPGMQAGMQAIETMLRAGLSPAVVRLYDALDTLAIMRRGGKEESDSPTRALTRVAAPEPVSLRERFKRAIPEEFRPALRAVARGGIRLALMESALINRVVERLPDRCMLILGFEGPAHEEALLHAQLETALGICTKLGAEDLGPDPGHRWLSHRYSVSYKQSPIFNAGAFADTMEVATTWDRLWPLYEGVRRAVTPRAAIMAHLSHAYAEGCSIYFTFTGGGADEQATLALYDEVWRRATRATLDAGASLSHHHGVGVSKGPGMRREHGPALDVLRELRRNLDPDSLMNPGKLGLDPPEGVTPVVASPSDPVGEAAAATFDGRNGTIDAPASMTLGEVEAVLRTEDHSLGFLPPELRHMRLSEVASGPAMARGSVWDLVLAVEGELAGQAFRTRGAPRSASGPDMLRLLLSTGEPTFRVTRLSLRARRLHGGAIWRSFRGPEPAVLAAARRVADLAPAPLLCGVCNGADGAELLVAYAPIPGVSEGWDRALAAIADDAQLSQTAPERVEELRRAFEAGAEPLLGARYLPAPGRIYPDDLAPAPDGLAAYAPTGAAEASP